jgi:transposase
MEGFTIAKTNVRYTPEVKRQMVDLVRAGRKPAELSREFGPTAWTISLWVTRRGRRETVCARGA